jgi:hypothetical protein
LYEIDNTLSDEQREEILAQITTLREYIALTKDRFGLEGEHIDLRKMLVGELTMFWVWLQETTTTKLRGYGAVDEKLQYCLDPLLHERTNRIDTALKTLAGTWSSGSTSNASAMVRFPKRSVGCRNLLFQG